MNSSANSKIERGGGGVMRSVHLGIGVVCGGEGEFYEFSDKCIFVDIENYILASKLLSGAPPTSKKILPG